MTTTPLVLRLLLLALLGVLVVIGVGRDEDGPRAVVLTGGTSDRAAIADVLLAAEPPPVVFRDAGREPTERELQALTALAERAPLVVALPERGPGVSLAAPELPRTGRYGAVEFTAHAAPGDTAIARLLDARGEALDSTRVVADSAGEVRGGFRVRPEREGWTEWRVAVALGAAAETVARVGVWVGAADPPRVLVVAGPPTWESRYVVRALEASGADLALVQALGRDNVITAGGASEAWWRPAALAPYDVLVLLPGASPEPEALDAVREWVAGGKGLVDASVEGVPRERRADGLSWGAPAAIAPLPSADLTVATRPVAPPAPGGLVAVRAADGAPVLALEPFGAGRVARVGLLETWRWAMEAGLLEEHRAFWRSLTDWLAVPSADSLGLRVAPVEAGTGVKIDVRSGASSLTVLRPGVVAPEPLAAVEDGTERGARFVAIEPGTHELRVDGSTVAAFLARPPDSAGAAVLGRARLSLLAAASGGQALDTEGFEARLAEAGASGGDAPDWPLLAFVLLVLLAITEWTLRRLRGLR